MTFENVKSESTRELVIKQIKKEIKSGGLNPGEKLPSERKLAELLGVSRTSIREAIQALSFSGYLEVKQGKGAYVTHNAEKYDEISNYLSKIADYSLPCLMEVREMLESEFARLATLRANEKDLKRICEAYNAMKSAKEIESFVREDLNFHLSIANATKNPLMDTLMKVFVEMLHKETNEIFRNTVTTRNNTLEVSGKLVEAMKNGKALKAKKLMQEHIRVIDKEIKK